MVSLLPRETNSELTAVLSKGRAVMLERPQRAKVMKVETALMAAVEREDKERMWGEKRRKRYVSVMKRGQESRKGASLLKIFCVLRL